jgi:membrane protease YdiL (CAAX protease family)
MSTPTEPTPTEPTPDPSENVADSIAGPSSNHWVGAGKPRVWPLFVLSLVELAFASVVQGAAAVALLFTTREEGQSIQEAAEALPTRLMEPPFFVLMIVLSGLSITAGAFLFGWISARHQRCSLGERLGLRWPTISPFSLACFLLGSVPVLLVSVGVVVAIETVVAGDESVLMLYKNMTNGWAIVFIILIGVLPGFGEELFFRGFIQRRMLQRYRPWVAIGVTSAVFGLFHVTPHGIALATIIGVWLGVIAWRTNSIWPSACCHAFINSGWNVYQVGRFQWGIPQIPPIWFSLVGGAVVIAAFVGSVRILLRTKPS